MEHPHRIVLAAALTLATACAGAGPSVRATPDPGSIRVGVLFKGACPYDLDVSASPCDASSKRCLAVPVAKGRAVHFEAVQMDPAAGDLDLAFSLDFDPFHKGNNPFKGKKNQLIQLAVDPAVSPPASPPGEKAFTFNVFSPGCPVLDPQIVIR